MKTIIIAVAALIATIGAKAQTIHPDSAGGKYVLIEPVSWQYGQHTCDRVYISSFIGNPSGVMITAKLGYSVDAGAYPLFVGPDAVYSLTPAQLDTLQSRMGGLLFQMLLNAKGLTPQ